MPEASEEVQLSSKNIDGSLREDDVLAGHKVETDDPLDIGDVGPRKASLPREG